MASNFPSQNVSCSYTCTKLRTYYDLPDASCELLNAWNFTLPKTVTVAASTQLIVQGLPALYIDVLAGLGPILHTRTPVVVT